MNTTRLQLAALLRLARQLFSVRRPDERSGPVPEAPLEVADEKLTAGLCMIAESLGSTEGTVLDVLSRANIEVRRANHASDIPRLVADRMPDFVITGPDADAAQVARALSDAGYKGPLQQLGGAAPIPYPPPAGIRVLPAIDVSTIDKDLFAVLQEDGMVRGQDGLVAVDLDVAARNRWLQFWYLPKINFRQGRLQGAELVPRIHHPRHGILDSSRFEIAGKDEHRILGYSAIRAAMRDWAAFDRIGFNMEFSVNLPADAFHGCEVAALVDGVRPPSRRWKGLRIELDVSTQAPNQAQIDIFRRELESQRVTLALDHVISSGQVTDRGGRFDEVKLDGVLITGCADDREKQRTLLSVLEAASRNNAIPVATGVSRMDDLRFIMMNHQTIPCGQGPVFSPAVSRTHFIRLLQARAHQAAAHT
jgi:EAL domain-containing protein (putative c-di-GMP-specific phosphodiesterase class I)